MRRVLVLTAAAVVLATNALTLIAAWHNRSSPSGGTLELTEREVRLVQMPWESTATLLELRWDVLSESPRDHGPPAWLDATKLAQLGFDCSVPPSSANAKEHYTAMPSALVFLVLEHEGQAWRQACRDRKPKTRLFVVDAGRDARGLRERYADTKRYVIARGVVWLSYRTRSAADGSPLATPRLRGRIESVLPGQIFVPQPYSRRLEGFRHRGPPARQPPEGKPRFAVTVSWAQTMSPGSAGSAA